jgi:hypothetical protein
MKSLNELAGIRSALYEKYVSQEDVTQSEFDNLFKFTVVTPFYWGVYDLANSSSVQGYWKNQYTTTTDGLVDSMVSVGYWTVDFKTKGNNIMFYFTDESEAMMCKLAV